MSQPLTSLCQNATMRSAGRTVDAHDAGRTLVLALLLLLLALWELLELLELEDPLAPPPLVLVLLLLALVKTTTTIATTAARNATERHGSSRRRHIVLDLLCKEQRSVSDTRMSDGRSSMV